MLAISSRRPNGSIWRSEEIPEKSSTRASGRTSPSCRLFLILGELFGRKGNKRSANALSRSLQRVVRRDWHGKARNRDSVGPNPPRGRSSAGRQAGISSEESGISQSDWRPELGLLTPESCPLTHEAGALRGRSRVRPRGGKDLTHAYWSVCHEEGIYHWPSGQNLQG